MVAVESLAAAPAVRAAAVDLSRVREGVLKCAEPVALHHGAELSGLRIGWRLVGPREAPVVVVLGGISAHRRVFAIDGLDDSTAGWWPRMVGPGEAIDAARLRILSFDYLGGSGDTDGPRDGGAFPAVSTRDQAELLRRLLDHLGIRTLHAIVGASYGGMVALAFGERHPERVSRLMVISAADRAHPMATAWRSLQRRIVRFGIESGQPARGLELARALAMATYRSPEEFAARFTAEPREQGGRFVFPVEDYLMARGEDYARRYRPDAFLVLSESIDLHAVDASRIAVPVTAVGIREDQLVPLCDMQTMCARLPRAQLHELSSLYGHDTFLKGPADLGHLVTQTLEVNT